MIYARKVYYFSTHKNGKQNGNQSYTKKYQIHVSCSFVYKLVYVDDQFCKPFKWYIVQDDIRKCVTSMTNIERQYWGHVKKEEKWKRKRAQF